MRAPTLLLDYRILENAIGSSLQQEAGPWERWIPTQTRVWFYRFALERGYLDACLNDFVVRPFLNTLRWCDAMERRWTDFLAGRQSRESEQIESSPEPLEELL